MNTSLCSCANNFNPTSLRPINTPSTDDPLLHDPPQPPLGQDSVLKVEATVLIDVWLTDAQLLTEPLVLWVSVVVLCCAQSMGHSFEAVHNRTGKVVCGVHSVGTCAREKEREGGGAQHSRSVCML